MQTAQMKYDLSDGHLERHPKQDPKTLAVFSGQMSCDALRISFFLVPDTKRKETSPDFRIMAVGRSGVAVPWGVAWEYRDKTDSPFISMLFQHPRLLRDGLNYVAWPDDEQPKDLKPEDEPVSFHIRWSRPRRGGGGVSAADDDFAGMVGAA